jgi:ribosomal protein L40E
VKCPNCQTDNPEGALFCKECGVSLQTELVCERCHRSNAPGSKFCVKCGQALSSVALPSSTPTPPTPIPASFANGRYKVKKFLGEGGKKKGFYISLVAGLMPIVILATIAMTQLGKYSYTKLGGIIIFIQAGYVILLIPITILFSILRKREIASGLRVSFGIGFFVALFIIGMGM